MTKTLSTVLAITLSLAIAPALAEAKAKAKAKPKSETAEIDAFFKEIDTSISKTFKQIDKDLASLSNPPKN